MTRIFPFVVLFFTFLNEMQLGAAENAIFMLHTDANAHAVLLATVLPSSETASHDVHRIDTTHVLLKTESDQKINIIGHITTSDQMDASFALVTALNSATDKMLGATCDEHGRFSIALTPGIYIFKIHLIGYNDLEKMVEVAANRPHHLDFVLEANPSETSTVFIYADKKDLAKMAMKNAIEARAEHLGKGSAYIYDNYLKLSIVRTQPDTTKADSTEKKIKRRDKPLMIEQLHLIESMSKVRYAPPASFHEEIIAYRDYVTSKPYDDFSVNVTMNYGETDIIPQQSMWANNYVLLSNSGYNEFNLYDRLLEIPNVCDKKVLSPLAEGAMLSYQFNIIHVIETDSMRLFEISVVPLFKGEPLFFGTVTIREYDWSLVHADLSLNHDALLFHDSFHFVQEYKKGPAGQYIIQEMKIDYTISEYLTTYDATVEQVYSDFNADVTPKKFSNETKNYAVDAFDKDSTYWSNTRQLTFTDRELEYTQRCDSLQKYYASEDYYSEKDSSYNHIKFLDFILYGVGYRNRPGKFACYFNPLIMQMNPLGVGGYRHSFGGSLQKEFQNAYLLEFDGMIDYGIRNQDIRGKVGAGLTYFPKKFVRTFVRVGDYYDMVNSYASFGSLFSRSNFVRTQTISVAQRMEIVNGLFAELTVEYSDQKPINNLKSDQWSSQVFGEINKPIDFDRYIKTEFRLDVKYRFAQKYIIKKGKKILLGSKYPELSFVYRKGVPGLWGSEVDFDYLEFGVRHEMELGRLGNMEWSVLGGSFVNRDNLRILEHRYFRGSDLFFFSDPTRSFQMLGPSLSTPNAFFRGNYFHHFDGIILNKIPLIRKLKLTEAAGAAYLAIPNQKFFHHEFSLGVERIIRIRQELFRVGFYACTSDSSWDTARMRFKIGLTFYNSFSRKWSY